MTKGAHERGVKKTRGVKAKAKKMFPYATAVEEEAIQLTLADGKGEQTSAIAKPVTNTVIIRKIMTNTLTTKADVVTRKIPKRLQLSPPNHHLTWHGPASFVKRLVQWSMHCKRKRSRQR